MLPVYEEFGFDNVFIVPRNSSSNVVSRSNVDTGAMLWDNTHNNFIKFDMALMLSPMSFFGIDAIRKINNRFLAFIPRIKAHTFEGETEQPDWGDINVRLAAAKELWEEGYHFGVAISLNDPEEKIRELQRYAMAFIVDTANGYNESVHQFINKLKTEILRPNSFYPTKMPIIISGNVVTHGGYLALQEAGSDYVRIGIGGGSNCTTSTNTAIGRPILSALAEVYNTALHNSPNKGNFLICDGGIKDSHDFSIAMLFSQFVMVSGIFKYSELSCHYDYASRNGMDIPAYGMASVYAKKHSEYVEGKITYGECHYFEEEYKKLKQGLQSAMSYLGASSIKEYHESDYNIVHSNNY